MKENEYSRRIMEVIDDENFRAWICNCHGTFRFPIYSEADYMSEDLAALELSVRAYNCLKRTGYTTVGSLVHGFKCGDNLERIRNCGIRSRREIMLSLFLYQYAKLSSVKRDGYQKQVMELNS